MAAEAEQQVSHPFGWFNLRPKWLQVLNKPRWFLFFMCQYICTLAIVVYGVYPGSISTIERRFGFTSFMMGWLTSSYDICGLVVTPLVSYIGGSRKKPVFCGVGLLVMSIGFVVFVLPHVISGDYQAGQTPANVSGVALCAANSTRPAAEVCGEESATGNVGYFALFILGMVLAGAGAAPMYSLGVPYMNANASPKAFPMYLGIFEGGAIVGSVVGYVVISLLLSVYIDVGAKTSLTPDDEGWLGAWWLGFVVFGSLGVFWSWWIMGFPKELPRTHDAQDREMHANSNTEPPSYHNGVAAGYRKLPDILKATKLILSKVSFVTITLGGCMEHIVLSSTITFMPKIVQFKFRLLPGNAALLFGFVSIPASLIGNLSGAYVNKRFALSKTGAAKLCFITAIFGLLSASFTYINCDDLHIAGVTGPYGNSSSTGGLSSPCNSACNCSGAAYSPVCADGSTFFSACHAGCAQAGSNEAYSNCSCVASDSGALGRAASGACGVNCGVKLVLFMTVAGLVSFFTFFHNTSAVLVTLRSVPPAQQCYALGLQILITRLLGAIPGPILLGALIDKTCILWDTSCGETSSCLEYDIRQTTLALALVIVVCKFITLIFFLATWLFSRRELTRVEQ